MAWKEVGKLLKERERDEGRVRGRMDEKERGDEQGKEKEQGRMMRNERRMVRKKEGGDGERGEK